MSKSNDDLPRAIQQNLSLPVVSIDTICAQELMRKMKAQAEALEVCGDYMLKQQVKIEQLAASVDSLVDLLTAHMEGRAPSKTPMVAPTLVGHPGYSVKEFAALLNRSATYVYRLLYNNEIEANRAGRITHESYVKMQTKMGSLQKRRRDRKWL